MLAKMINRIIATLSIAIILFWSAFPVVGYASFITPGEVMKPGKVSKPGEIPAVGEFMIPGEVMEPGEVVEGGETPSSGGQAVTGQPLLPQAPYKSGNLLIPNVPPPPTYPIWLIITDSGSVLDPSDPNGGKVTGGTGEGITAGENPSGGKIEKGDGMDSNGNMESGDSGSTKNVKSESPFAKENNAFYDTGELPHPLRVMLKSSDPEDRGVVGHVSGAVEDYKEYYLGFLNKEVIGGATSWYAGFNLKRVEGKNGFKVSAKREIKNSIFKGLYNEYLQYDDAGKSKSLGNHTKYIKESTFNKFRQTKGLWTTDTTYASALKQSLSNVNNEWNPLSIKKDVNSWNPFKKVGLNKAFGSGSMLGKLSGPMNYALAAVGSVYDFGEGGKMAKFGYQSTEFAASLTTEIGIGVATTGLSSIASSVAAGALVGSAVPGLGTVVGAAAGLAVAVASNYLLNGTTRGKRLKSNLTQAVNLGYKKVTKGIRSAWGGLKGLVS
ncbi:hypothetical protein [Mangrovibacillus cuniculi]|uniref:Uncharacterized protein n=1 Tax=Mangrovibacillus cuniculi TaxID=2593652 RepID=A0A7S8HH50_9BACI|nr:hypothetical protein [Mangrovibacillus cuniculi]QPC48276.1 hypothetical protein G8O30_15795 [Mangrovibacillus cuniculi]